MKKIIQIFSNIFKNVAFMTLLGVVIGGFISGYFANKSQLMILNSQKQEFILKYQIERNNELKEQLELFIDNLSKIISPTEKDHTQYKTTINAMANCSIKMTLLEDQDIGTSSLALTNQINQIYKGEKIDDAEISKVMEEWMVSVKDGMKKIEYRIGSSDFKIDLLKQLLFKTE
jgi:hypothetical protein